MKEIGGYFELEIRNGEGHYHPNALKLNTARNCFEYILRARQYKKVYIPYYTCEVILEPLRKCNVAWVFYHIDSQLEPTVQFSLGKEEAFLYTNYFGLKQSYIQQLSVIYGAQLIIDNAQAFFAQPIIGVDTFYSARKFFGVPDGAYLYTDVELDSDLPVFNPVENMRHLIGRMSDSAGVYYANFQKSENVLSNMEIQKMSVVSEQILKSLDYEHIINIRRSNFETLHGLLDQYNFIHPLLDSSSTPMVYPFYSSVKKLRNKLIENSIYVPKYWTNVLEWTNSSSLEHMLCENLCVLPIDQRYGKTEMSYLANIIKERI